MTNTNVSIVRLKNFNLTVGGQIFKAFGDESRVRIMHLLFKNEAMCITDLELVLDFSQTKTSRHLTYLKNAGLLKASKLDQWVFYDIKQEFYDIVAQILRFLEKDPVLLQDQETFEILHSNRELAICKIDQQKWQQKMTEFLNEEEAE